MKLKLLLVLVAVLFLAANASAVFDLNIHDANGVRHAAPGVDDLNIDVGDTNSQFTGLDPDYNYLIRLHYNDGYEDVNAGGIYGADVNAASGSETILTNRMLFAAQSGSCDADENKWVNLIQLSDYNNFHVDFNIPSDTNFTGKEVAVELWRVQDTTGDGNGYICIQMDANAGIVITPAIVLSHTYAAVDTNITVMGYGFAPDRNVLIRVYDRNGLRVDMNIMDVNYVGNKYVDIDTALDINIGDIVLDQGGGSLMHESQFLDVNGFAVIPDLNGNFDINIILPYVDVNMLGRLDRNAIVANIFTAPDEVANSLIDADSDLNSDRNALWVPAPGIRKENDMNVYVWVCNESTGMQDCDSAAGGRIMHYDEVVQKGYIQDWTAVEGFTIEMGNPGDWTAVKLAFNTDINFRKASFRDYNADIDWVANNGSNAKGRVKVDSSKMKELNVDVNITFYSIDTAWAAYPYIMKDGRSCAATDCTNLDGSWYTGSSWEYNSENGDGNLSFNVSAMSTFEIVDIDLNLLRPTGGEFRETDGNMRIQFKWRDANVDDVNAPIPPAATIYYSTVPGDQQFTAITDSNLLDDQIITCDCNSFCTRYESNHDLNTWRTCTYDFNFTGITGIYWIDVNVTQPPRTGGTANIGVQNVYDVNTMDKNLMFNAPMIHICDVNLNSGTWERSVTDMDANYNVDFNILIPDRNYSLQDFNIYFYYATAPSDFNNPVTGRAITDKDINLGTHIDGLIKCTDNNSMGGGPMPDTNCVLEWDINAIWEGRYYLVAKLVADQNRGDNDWTTLKRMGGTDADDQNALWDFNATERMFAINDTNNPVLTYSNCPNGDATTTSSSFDLNAICRDDKDAGVPYKFFTSYDNVTWTDANADYSFTVTDSGTYYMKCSDAGDNNSDVNACRVTFQESGGQGFPPDDGDEMPEGVPGGSVGGGTDGGEAPTTETVLSTGASIPLTNDDLGNILGDAGASEEDVQNAQGAVDKIETGRNVKVEKTTDGSQVSHKTTMSSTIKNTTNKILKNVKVVENVPKTVASDASEISSDFTFTVLLADPIIEFLIDEIGVGETFTLSYSVDKEVDQEDLEGWVAPIVISFSEEEPLLECTQDAQCNDYDSCTADVCAGGRCSNGAVIDGTPCGTGMHCIGGACITKPSVVLPTTPTDYTMAIVLLVIAIIILAAYAVAKKRQKPAV
jgi:hypothetical protein